MVDDGVGGVSGHVKNLDVGPLTGDARGEFRTSELGHDDVGEEEIAAAELLQEDFEITNASGGVNGIAVSGENVSGQAANQRIVFDEKNGVRAAPLDGLIAG